MTQHYGTHMNYRGCFKGTLYNKIVHLYIVMFYVHYGIMSQCFFADIVNAVKMFYIHYNII